MNECLLRCDDRIILAHNTFLRCAKAKEDARRTIIGGKNFSKKERGTETEKRRRRENDPDRRMDGVKYTEYLERSSRRRDVVDAKI